MITRPENARFETRIRRPSNSRGAGRWRGAPRGATRHAARSIRGSAPEGARNSTVAFDRRSGEVYLAWAQEVSQEVSGPAPKDKDRKKADPKLEVRVARSDDGGRTFGPPVVVSTPEDRVESSTVSPTQLAMAPKGVYVLYSRHDPDVKPAGWEWAAVSCASRAPTTAGSASRPLSRSGRRWSRGCRPARGHRL